MRTVLGVSNISFGLPYRELLNATFLTAAFAAGLDLAIMNPLSERFMDAVAAWRVFNKQDLGAADYIAANAGRTNVVAKGGPSATGAASGEQASVGADAKSNTPEARIRDSVINLPR